jgi:hypothetical protein
MRFFWDDLPLRNASKSDKCVAYYRADKMKSANVLAYYDRSHRYVEVFDNLKTGEKSVCRLTDPDVFEDIYTCTDWYTEKVERWRTDRDPMF